jgi:hypothetical protein
MPSIGPEPPILPPAYWLDETLEPIVSAKASAAEDWQKLTVTFTSWRRHGWNHQPRFKANLGEGGTVYLDDVQVTSIAKDTDRED